MAKLFYKTAPAESKKEEGKPFSYRKLLRMIVLLAVVSLALGLVIVQGKGFYTKVSESWEEIMFAWQKPHLVETLRKDYETKQQKLEQSFLIREKSSEDKLVDEVVKRLQTADQLK